MKEEKINETQVKSAKKRNAKEKPKSRYRNVLLGTRKDAGSSDERQRKLRKQLA